MNLVIDMNGVVFTQIPHSMRSGHQNVLQIGTSRKDSKNTYFIPTPNIVQLIESVGINDNLKIHLINNLPDGAAVDSFTNSIQFKKIKASNLTGLRASVISAKKVDINLFKKIDPSLDSIFYLSGGKSDEVKELKNRSLTVDNSKILFLTFSEADSSLKELKDFPVLLNKLKDNIPGDKAAWESSFYRLARPAMVLNQLLNSPDKGFDLSKRVALDESSTYEGGKGILNGTFKPVAPKWSVKSNSVQCVKYDFIEGAEVSSLDIDVCKKNFSNWNLFYTDNSGSSCALYIIENNKVSHVRDEDVANCKNKRFIVTDPANSKYGVLHMNDEVRKLSFEEARVMALASKLSFKSTPKETFGSIFMEPMLGRNLVNAMGGEGSSCVTALRKVYSSGEGIELQAIRKRLITLKDYMTRTGINNDFFHHTNVNSLYSLFKPEEANRQSVHESLYQKDKEGYGSILWYLKSLGRPTYDDMYMAEDPNSSRSYGNIQLKFYISEDAMVFDDLQTAMGDYNFQSEMNSEIAQKYPNVSNSCSNVMGNIYYFAMDDSGVDIQDYYNNNSWFKLTNSSVITGCEVRRF